jgi:hypothetical protein
MSQSSRQSSRLKRKESSSFSHPLLSSEVSFLILERVKNYVGFVFTDAPLKDLVERGFAFQQVELGADKGYRSFVCRFPNATQFELREILDEQSYLASFRVDHFQPFIEELALPAVQASQNENSVSEILGNLSSLNLNSGELRSYLDIRKSFPLWAVEMKCEDFSLFCQRARPDRIFHSEGRSLALIHLGPNCFDLIIRS